MTVISRKDGKPFGRRLAARIGKRLGCAVFVSERPQDISCCVIALTAKAHLRPEAIPFFSSDKMTIERYMGGLFHPLIVVDTRELVRVV